MVPLIAAAPAKLDSHQEIGAKEDSDWLDKPDRPQLAAYHVHGESSRTWSVRALEYMRRALGAKEVCLQGSETASTSSLLRLSQQGSGPESSSFNSGKVHTN